MIAIVAQIQEVLLEGRRKHNNVVQVRHGVGPQQSAQHLVHEPLEGSRRILESHAHNKPFVVSVGCYKSCLFHCGVRQSHLVIPGGKVQLREESCL